jgi:altronate dehydratase
MDSSSAAAEMVTLCAAAGLRRSFLPDRAGQRNRQPDPAVIKLCANPRTVRTMSEHVDVDVTGLLQRDITMSEAGDKLLDMMFRTANGGYRGRGAGAPRIRVDAAVRKCLSYRIWPPYALPKRALRVTCM